MKTRSSEDQAATRKGITSGKLCVVGDRITLALLTLRPPLTIAGRIEFPIVSIVRSKAT